jgi:hypothetical protein
MDLCELDREPVQMRLLYLNRNILINQENLSPAPLLSNGEGEIDK